MVPFEAGLTRRDRAATVQLGADNARWFVVHTRPHNEPRAITNLHRQGFETFNPCIRRTISHARKKATVLTPLFPSYVFVRFDPTVDQWGCINGTFGVVRLITNGDVPAAVPKGVVPALQAHISDDGTMDWTARLHIGDQVRVTEGPFVNLIGTLEHLDSSGRVRILLDLLGRSVAVTIPGEAVMPQSRSGDRAF